LWNKSRPSSSTTHNPAGQYSRIFAEQESQLRVGGKRVFWVYDVTALTQHEVQIALLA
jgi:hypothetical protein